jgi:nitrite reductase/ring-hydroxylating ferredoxin subunit
VKRVAGGEEVTVAKGLGAYVALGSECGHMAVEVAGGLHADLWIGCPTGHVS